MAAPLLQRQYTVEELLQLPDAEQFELVDGQLRGREVSFESSRIAQRFNRIIDEFAEARGLGAVVQSDMGMRLFPDRPNWLRRPDGAFVRAENVPQADVSYLTVAPDLVVEVVSPTDHAQEVRSKAVEWLAAGVRLVWVVFPATREVQVSRAGGRTEIFGPVDVISGEDVLPGFTRLVADFFPG